MTRIITFDPDAIDEIDALYLVDLLNDILQQDEITEALTRSAFDIASSQADLADEIYPQPGGETTWHQHKAKRNEHLRRFGILKEVTE